MQIENAWQGNWAIYSGSKARMLGLAEVGPAGELPEDATVEQTKYFFESAASTFKTHFSSRYKKMFEVLIQSRQLTGYISKDAKLRTAWAGYVARAGLYCCNGLFSGPRPMFNCVDTIGARLQEYDRAKELKQKMVVGLSGNLDIDLQTNFIARLGAKANTQEFINLVHWLYGFCTLMMAENIAYGMIGAAFLPRVETTEDALSEFFNELTHTENPMDEDDAPSRQRQELTLALKNNVDSWIQALTLPASQPIPGGKNTSIILPGTGTYCTEADVQVWQKASIQIGKILGSKNHMPTVKGGAIIGLSTTEQSYLRTQIAHTAMIGAEREAMAAAVKDLTVQLKAKAYTEKIEKRLEQSAAPPKASKHKAPAIPAGKILLDQAEWELVRRQNEKLNQSLAKAESSNDVFRQTMAQLTEAQQELDALRQKLQEKDEELQSMANALLVSSQPQEDENETDIESLDASILDNINIVCIGGHPSFIRGLQQLHNNIRCFGNHRPADSSVIHSDVVWVQTNCISHELSIPVVNLCRQYGIPLRFFAYAGHIPCRFQMVKETQKMFELGLLKQTKP